jgi:ribA/ribD-fused uncharacterized protein
MMADNNTTGEPTSPVSALKGKLLAKYPKSQVEGLMCIINCKHNGEEADIMLHCCTCAHWFHADCVDLKEDEAVGIWPCHTCRFIAHDIVQQQLTINKLIDIINAQQVQINEIRTSQVTGNKNIDLLTQNLQNLTSDITPELCSESGSNSDTDSEDEDDEPEGHFFIGDSMIKDVYPNDDDLVLNYQSGAKLLDVRKKIKNIRGMKYKDMTIVCGTNDSATKRPVEKIIEDYKATITIAKTKALHVNIARILPRADMRADMAKIDTLNQMLVLLTNEEGVNFVNNDNNFRYRDDTPDESLLLPEDKLHLSAIGTTRLLKNLGLADMAVSRLGKGPSNRWAKGKPGNPMTQQRARMSSVQYIPEVRGFPPPIKQNTAGMPNLSSSPNQARPPLAWQNNGMHNIPLPPSRQWPGNKNLPHLKRKYYFKGGNNPLSNFYMVKLSVFGQIFSSVEHAYQWRKAKYLGLHSIADRIMRTNTASQVKTISDDELETSGTDWKKERKTIMYDLLMIKCQQFSAFLPVLMQSEDDELIEDTQHEYWARGRSGQGQNTLGQLLMIIRHGLMKGHSTQTSPDYRPPANGAASPCYQCGEENHNSETCRHQGFVQCRQCLYQGHKSKHCPDRF